MPRKLKSQAFYTDFIISILIFSVILIIYFVYTTNLQNGKGNLLDDLLTDAKTISSSLTTGGHPDNWKAATATRIGFTDNGNRIDNDKFNEYMKIDYNESKKLLGTIHDYFLFFVNGSGDVQSIEGFCGFGNAGVNISYDIKAAYYYKDEDKLKEFMEDVFKADVYSPAGPDINDLIANIYNYGFIVIESPEFPTSIFNEINDDIENWVSSGGIFMLSARPLAAQGGQILGVEFYKISGDAGMDKPATVVREDEFISFDYGDQIIFNQVYYIVDVSVGANLLDIARFNESDIEIEDILDNKIALARWPYGDGKAFFFSDFDADYLAGDFQKVLEDSAKKWLNARCLPINISNVKRDNLVKVDRLLIYNSDIVKMVMYIWS